MTTEEAEALARAFETFSEACDPPRYWDTMEELVRCINESGELSHRFVVLDSGRVRALER